MVTGFMSGLRIGINLFLANVALSQVKIELGLLGVQLPQIRFNIALN